LIVLIRIVVHLVDVNQRKNVFQEPVLKTCINNLGKKKKINFFFFYRLLRRQAPSPSASFFERMQFLIQEDGLQTSSIYSSFNERYF